MQKATGTADKKEVIIEGASHIETYRKPEYVSQISEALTQFLKPNSKHGNRLPEPFRQPVE